MVATSMHFLIGVTIAWFFGYRDKRKWTYGLWGALPDIDALIIAYFLVLKNFFGISISFLEDSVLWVILFAHRGISHSLLLIGIVLLLLWGFKASKKMILFVGLAVGSHLFLDAITAWKMFPFLPLSFFPVHLGVVEVFDSFLMFFTTILLALFICIDIINGERRRYMLSAYAFVFIFGFFPAMTMGEFNMQTVILAHIVLIGLLTYSYFSKKSKEKERARVTTGVRYTSLVVVGYLGLLLVMQFGYAVVLKTSPTHIEPLEEFAFNYNAHTYEVPTENGYDIGLVSFKGIEETGFVEKIQDPENVVDDALTQNYLDAFEKSLHSNWFNYPVFIFHQDEEGIVYVNIRYAKSFLENPHMPGPRNGIDVTLKNGLLVAYGESWF